MNRLLRSLAVSLVLATLASCSCCGDGASGPEQTLSFVVDDATATRISAGPPRAGHGDPPECRDECDVLSGRTDAGAADADVPDAGATHPTLPAGSCTLAPTGTSWLLTCYYFTSCPA